MAWFYVLIAGLFEIVWAIGLKYTEGFTRLTPSAITIAGMIISFVFLAQATKVLPIGTVYAIWTGIGIIGTTILGMVLFNEPFTAVRVLFIILILIGVCGLKLVSGNH